MGLINKGLCWCKFWRVADNYHSFQPVQATKKTLISAQLMYKFLFLLMVINQIKKAVSLGLTF